eukprot:COSAG05_NODE_11803_length_495_cov_1.189394_2_plen_41_part_01
MTSVGIETGPNLQYVDVSVHGFDNSAPGPHCVESHHCDSVR